MYNIFVNYGSEGWKPHWGGTDADGRYFSLEQALKDYLQAVRETGREVKIFKEIEIEVKGNE